MSKNFRFKYLPPPKFGIFNGKRMKRKSLINSDVSNFKQSLWKTLTKLWKTFCGFLWGIVGNFVLLRRFSKKYLQMARFIGNIDAKLDEKGRVFFPAVFRRVMQKEGEEALMVRKDIHQNCLVLYPKSVWNAQLDEMRRVLNRWNSRDQMVFRQFVAGVDELPIDGNGRILIPKRLQQLVNLQASVRFIGIDDTIELWSKDEAEALLENPADLGENIERLLGGAPMI